MLEAIKKLDRKFLIFASCILLLPILLIIFLLIIQGCDNKKISYESYEKKMVKAAEEYFEKNNLLPTEESAMATVDLDKLVEEEYIKNTEKLLDDDTCDGKVTVRRNGSSIEENEGGFLNYTVNLTCKNYNTNTLISLLMTDLTTSESGLYKQENDYVFKGDDVDNYVNFGGTLYRVLRVDANNIVKLIQNDRNGSSQSWDTKYNSDVNYSYGKNIYKDSSLRKKIVDYYNNNKIFKNVKNKIVLYDVCAGSRDINDTSLNSGSDCSTILENQPISLMNITDYANASLDSECTSITSKSCRNYNYLKNIISSSWTLNAVSNNSYEVYYLTGGVIDYQEGSKFVPYNIVIYIDGNELVNSGKGTEQEPYVIK